MTLTLTIQDQPNGLAFPDLTPRLTRAVCSTNLHGDEACQLSASLNLPSSFERYDHPGLPHVIITDGGATPFQGRIEDTSIRSAGIDLTAFGYQRALSDSRYTALWSATSVADWGVLTSTDIAGTNSDMYIADNNNRLYLGLKKGTVYTTVVDFGIWGFRIPDGSSRNIVGVSFDMTLSLPAGWTWFVQSRSATWGGPVNIDTVAGGVGVSVMNRFYTFTGAAAIDVGIYNSAGVNYANAAEDGTYYMRITNVRVVTATTNAVNTTTTANVVAGANINVPVVSSARMYVGQRLHLGIPAALGFNATVLSVPDSTHFRADLSAAMASGGNVQAFVIYSDEIVRDLVSAVSTQNPAQLLPDTTQVTSPALDLFDESFTDMLPNAVLDHLITLGDSASTPGLWEWGVTGARVLFYRAPGVVSQQWFVDATDLTVQRSLEQLWNSAYAVYGEAGGRTLRGAVSTNAASVTETSITRTQAVAANTTSLVQANTQRDASLDDTSDPAPRFGLTFSAIYNNLGGRVPIWLPRAGDTITIRNLPPTISVSIDQLRTFRIARTTCDLIARTLTVEPLTPLPSVQALLAKDARKKRS